MRAVIATPVWGLVIHTGRPKHGWAHPVCRSPTHGCTYLRNDYLF